MQLYLSDAAYEKLLEDARFANYVRGSTGRGLAPYLSGLLQNNPLPTNWQDTRPEHIKDFTHEELSAGQFATWDDGALRSIHFLEVTAHWQANSAILAQTLGVVRQGPALRVLKPASLISQFWEAVGLVWLTPEHNAPIPQYNQDHRAPKWEIEW